MDVSNRDIGDERLWRASHHRSIQRRQVVAARRRGRLPRATSTGVALAATAASALAVAGPAAAGTGLADVQRALGITADGVMGPQTRSALRRFQREHGLDVDGRVGSETRKALGLSSSRRSSSSTSGSSLADVQRKLGVEADGVIGPQTRSAIREFQSEHDLDATGRLDSATRKAILSSEDAPTSGAKVRNVSSTAEADAPAAPAEGVAAAVEAARAQIGKPYQSAGKGPGGFDCSGLTAYVFRQAGTSLGSSSFAQYGQGTSIQRSEIQAGDLVFFNSNGSGASHVGIATGPTSMISATTHGVMEASFSSGYWASHYVGARRVSS